MHKKVFFHQDISSASFFFKKRPKKTNTCLYSSKFPIGFLEFVKTIFFIKMLKRLLIKSLIRSEKLTSHKCISNYLALWTKCRCSCSSKTPITIQLSSRSSKGPYTVLSTLLIGKVSELTKEKRKRDVLDNVANYSIYALDKMETPIMFKP